MFHRCLSLSLLLAALALTACGIDDDFTPRDYGDNDGVATSSIAPSYLDLSPVPPPAVSDEMSQVTDRRTQVWRHGHWSYEHQQFVWNPGEVLTRPSPTAIWSPDRWEHRTYGWAYIKGYWQ